MHIWCHISGNCTQNRYFCQAGEWKISFIYRKKKKMLRNVIVSTRNVPQTQGEKSHIFNFMKKDTVSLNVYFKS